MHDIHDFTAKLRQPSLQTQVGSYVAWRRRLAAARAAGLPDPDPPALAPVSINLDLTTACNYRCDHCIDWDILNSKHRHDEERLRHSLELMAGRGLRSVIVIGGGEPTLYPGFGGFVHFLKQLRLQVAVVSNGSRGDRLLEAAERLEEPDWIRLSLDSGSNELFAAMHKPVSRSVTLDSICEWVPRIKASNRKVRVGFSFIIVWRGTERSGVEIHENIHEIVLAAERAKRYAFDYIAYKPVLERGPEGDEVMDPLRAEEEFERVVARIGGEVERAQRLAGPGFDVYESTNLRLLRRGAWPEFTRQPQTCHMQALRQVLTPMGLFNCPAHRGVAKAQVAGSDAYEDPQQAERTAHALASLMDRFDASRECSRVTCLYNPVNWWLEKMIEDPRRDLESEASPERFDHFL